MILFFSFLVVASLPLSKLKMLLSIDDLADPDFSTYTQLKDLNQNYLNQDEIFLVIRKKENQTWQKREICDVSTWLHHIANNRGDIKAVISTLGIQRANETKNNFKIRPVLLPDCVSSESESQKIEQGFADIKNSPWRGTLTSKASDDIAVLIYPDARKGSSFFGTFDHKIIEQLQESFQKEVNSLHPQLKPAWIGDGILQYHLRKGYEHMPVLNLIMSLLIMIFFRFIFGTYLSSWIFLSCVTWVSIPIYGGMALLGHPIDVLSSSLSLMIFVSALEDYLFVSYLMKEVNWRKAFRKLLLPSFFTSLTTVIGFGSLIFADIDIIRRFGLWAAVAAALEWIVLFVALPAVCIKFPRIHNWVRNDKIVKIPFGISRLARYSLPKYFRYVSLIVFPLAILATQHLYVSDSPELLLEKSHPARQALNKIESSRGWRGSVSLVFADHDDKPFHQKVVGELRSWPLIEKIEDGDEISKYLTQGLSQSMSSYMQNILNKSTLGQRLGPHVNESRVILYLKSLDIVDVNKLRREILTVCPPEKCWLAGTVISYGELGERVLSTLYKSLGMSLGLVSIVILFLCLALSPSSFLPLIVSSMWGPAALLVIFYVFHIPVFYITSMIASILIGITGDNAIQFLFFSSAQKNIKSGLSRLAPAAVLVAVGMILASTVFFFGYFAPMKTLGLMLIIGFTLSLLGDIWVLKTFVK